MSLPCAHQKKLSKKIKFSQKVCIETKKVAFGLWKFFPSFQLLMIYIAI